MTVLLSILILEIFKTKRVNNRNEELHLENRELENKIHILEKKREEIIEYNCKLQIQIAREEEKIYYLEQMLSNKKDSEFGTKRKK